jgi:DNA polymerase III alpha subunit (gram-positive type)
MLEDLTGINSQVDIPMNDREVVSLF